MRFLLSVVSCGSLLGCAAPIVDNMPAPASFSDRCNDPNVIRCFGFEIDELMQNGGPIHWGWSDAPVGVFANGMSRDKDLTGRVEFATDQAASGLTSLKFYMPSRSGAGFGGQFYANFSDDYSVQFGEGDEFYVQWRQRFSQDFLSNRYYPVSNWKQIVVGEGNRTGVVASSCSQLELVVNQDNYNQPGMYHSCGGKDGRYEGIDQKWSANYIADQWMTFQLHVRIGSWYRNDRRYRRDSLIELWVAEEGGQSRELVAEKYDLANNDPDAEYGKIWLLPYLSRKDSSQEHPNAYTWYDELIISRAPIADPR